MGGEWPIVPLSAVIEKGRRITYGIVQPGMHDPTGVPILRVSDIRGGRLFVDDPLRVAETVAAQFPRTRLVGGELLLTLVGTVGEMAIAPPELAGWNLARAVGLIPVRQDVGAYWVRLAMQAPEVKERISGRVNTTVQSTLNLSDVADLPIVLPPERERRHIAELLGVLDTKIELNRRTVETLEAMARALFKSWFVDFDPVRAKAGGRPTGLPASLAALFPNRLGGDRLPEGWEMRGLYDFARVVYGAPFTSARFNSDGVGLPLIRVRDLVAHDPDIYTDEEHRIGHVIEPGDIVVGMDGEFRCHFWRGPNAYLNQRLCHFEPVNRVPRSFVALSLHEPLARFEAGAVGTTVIHLGKKDLDTVTFVHPGKGVLAAFGEVSEPLIDRAMSVAQQSQTLAALRDTLLPKLISGELRIRYAERAAAVA